MLRWTAPQLLLLILFGLSPAISQERPTQKPSKSVKKIGPHGGTLHIVDGYRCEVVFTARSVRVHVFDSDGHALRARHFRGRLSLHGKKNGRTYRYDLYPETATGSSLYLPIDLSRIAKKSQLIEITLHGLPNPSQEPIIFATKFHQLCKRQQLAIKPQQFRTGNNSSRN